MKYFRYFFSLSDIRGKKIKIKHTLLVISGILLILLTYCKKEMVTDEYGSIDFIFNPTNKSTQFAIWVEDWEGTFIGTVFLTNFIGKEGGGNRTSETDIDLETGNRLSALPVWCHKRDITDNTFGLNNYYPPSKSKDTYPGDVAAISGATPGNTLQYITWQLPILPYGKYNCWIEVNRSYDLNEYHKYSYYRGQPSVVWKASLNISGIPDSSTVLSYSGYGSPDGSNGNINPPDNTITTASDLLEDMGRYKFKVFYTPY